MNTDESLLHYVKEQIAMFDEIHCYMFEGNRQEPIVLEQDTVRHYCDNCKVFRIRSDVEIYSEGYQIAIMLFTKRVLALPLRLPKT